MTYVLEGQRSLVTQGWQWDSLGKALLAIAVVGVISMSLCLAALRGGPGAADAGTPVRGPGVPAVSRSDVAVAVAGAAVVVAVHITAVALRDRVDGHGRCHGRRVLLDIYWGRAAGLPREIHGEKGNTGLVDADVVVIGAGALGLSTGLHCALAGRSVVVVERCTAGSQASGRAAGLFKSVQADELRTRLARRSIEKAASFADWAGVPLEVARPGSFLIARTAQHRDYLRRELAQSRGWGADVREASPGQLADGLSYYQPGGGEFALWCPEDAYIEEPASLVQAYLDACRLHGAVVLENEPVAGITRNGRAGDRCRDGRAVDRGAGGGGRGRRLGAPGRRTGRARGCRVAPVRHQLLITAPAPTWTRPTRSPGWSTPPCTCARPAVG